MPGTISSTATSFTLRSISVAASAATSRWLASMERWIAHLLGIKVDIEPFTEVRDASLSWYVGLDADGTKIGDALWNGEELDERQKGSVVGLYRLTFPDPSIVVDRARGEPVFLILASGARQSVAAQAAEFGHRLADQTSGGGVVKPLVTIPVGVIIERHKAASKWIDYTWRPIAVMDGRPETAPWTLLREEGEVATFFAGMADIDLHPGDTASYRDNLSSAEAKALGGAAADRRRSAL